MTGIREQQRKDDKRKKVFVTGINLVTFVLLIVFFGMNVVSNTRIVKLQDKLDANQLAIDKILDDKEFIDFE